MSLTVLTLLTVKNSTVHMLTLDECRSTDPRLANIPDEEMFRIREAVYVLAKISLDDYLNKQTGSTVSPLVIYPSPD